jgi:8-oxo-dGTP pyrophosphatase MutT (NUDIX family)/phosphohistidine phosphatase SixA
VARVVIRAAGVVLLNEFGHVATVHRARRDDWSLPKGKLEPGEYPIDAARRETREETGIEIILGSRLPSARYQAAGQPKEVDYWVAKIKKDHGFVAGTETDELRWVDLDVAAVLFTYPHDVKTAELAVARPTTSPLILLRHATAMKRVDWSGADAARPLRPEGLVEADRLVSQLVSFGVEAIHSSDAERCVATVAPLALLTSAPIKLESELSEGGFEHDPGAAASRAAALAADARAIVVCTHRPICPALLRRLVSELAGDPAAPALDPRIAPGGFIVLHRSFEAGQVRLVSTEVHLPTE